MVKFGLSYPLIQSMCGNRNFVGSRQKVGRGSLSVIRRLWSIDLVPVGGQELQNNVNREVYYNEWLLCDGNLQGCEDN